MSLFLRGKVWWMELRDPATGKVFRESTRVRLREVAERVHEVRKAELVLEASGANLAPAARNKHRTWEEAAERWLFENHHKRDLKGDETKLTWLAQHFAGKKLAYLSRDEIMDVLRLKAKQTSPSTGNRYLSLVRAILRRAANEWEWIDKTPTLRQFKEPPGRERWLRPEEIVRLLRELPEHLRDMTEFALLVGQRQGAIRKLAWDRVELDQGFCWIDHATSKSGRPIPVPLNEQASAILKRQIGKHPKFVFTYRGAPIRNVNTRAWHKALKRAGIEDFRWHDTRHTWASHHAQNGTPIHVIKELGGWANMAMPLRYAHFSTDALKRYANNAPRHQQQSPPCTGERPETVQDG